MRPRAACVSRISHHRHAGEHACACRAIHRHDVRRSGRCLRRRTRALRRRDMMPDSLSSAPGISGVTGQHRMSTASVHVRRAGQLLCHVRSAAPSTTSALKLRTARWRADPLGRSADHRSCRLLPNWRLFPHPIESSSPQSKQALRRGYRCIAHAIAGYRDTRTLPSQLWRRSLAMAEIPADNRRQCAAVRGCTGNRRAVTGRRGEALVDDRTTRTASPDLDATWIHQRPGRRCISTAHTLATANMQGITPCCHERMIARDEDRQSAQPRPPRGSYCVASGPLTCLTWGSSLRCVALCEPGLMRS